MLKFKMIHSNICIKSWRTKNNPVNNVQNVLHLRHFGCDKQMRWDDVCLEGGTVKMQALIQLQSWTHTHTYSSLITTAQTHDSLKNSAWNTIHLLIFQMKIVIYTRTHVISTYTFLPSVWHKRRFFFLKCTAYFVQWRDTGTLKLQKWCKSIIKVL